MSFGNSVLSKLGLGEGGMSTLLPLHISPPRRSPEEHDLAELSPRPDDALLSPDYSRESTPSGMDRNTTRSKGKGKAIAFAYQDRPLYSRSRTTNSVNDYSFPTSSNQNDLKVPPGIWRPNIHSERRNSTNATPTTHTSFVESIFLGRADRPSDRMLRSEVDHTFKMLQRREGQIQKELQKLLDAQGAALERDLAGEDAGKTSPKDSRRALSPNSTASAGQLELSGGSVMPVRQPKKRPMSKRQARIGIARLVTMLADLKNEEDAYIAGALAARKAALSKLRNLSSQRRAIESEMKAFEEDNELPIKTRIATMEDQHRQLSTNIEKLEERLRVMKRTKADLERRLDEARSTRDASLSGYRGALRQCDQGIDELMKYPGIQVLEVAELKEQGAQDVAELMSKHMSGVEFLSLRPERRTIEMAKDWWEGEVAVLEQRKLVVDKEQAALEEGSELWQQVVTLLTDFEARLQQSVEEATKQRNFEPDTPESLLRDQYKSLKTTLRELQKQYDYVESKGWNLLIAAIGAELAHLESVKEFLKEVIRSSGYDNGSLTPSTPSGSDLVDVRENGALGAGTHAEEAEEDEELSRSVVRRWDDVDEQQHRDGSTVDLLGADGPREESDNEVPPGLLSEIHPHESEDEHQNEVPVEFLSMHSPPQRRDEHRNRSRESSETNNEVPPDLLAEPQRGDDGVD
ncbi:hypothetical protein F5Y05DRAFT_405576 [Hypoxylon sp. FL0543]|nr:hypothetical protein F5Y05DRAFT_405576 [Hypoxylon sp. FL0543]